MLSACLLAYCDIFNHCNLFTAPSRFFKYESTFYKGTLSNIANMSARTPGPRYKCWRDHGQISAGPGPVCPLLLALCRPRQKTWMNNRKILLESWDPQTSRRVPPARPSCPLLLAGKMVNAEILFCTMSDCPQRSQLFSTKALYFSWFFLG